MATLVTKPNIANVDDVYAMLIEAHQGLEEARSAVLNAKLILTLVNHIGDEEVIRQALKLAVQTADVTSVILPEAG